MRRKWLFVGGVTIGAVVLCLSFFAGQGLFAGTVKPSGSQPSEPAVAPANPEPGPAENEQPATFEADPGTQWQPEPGVMVDNPLDTLVLVNKHHNLSADYVPPDLVVPNIPFSFAQDLPKKQLREEAARAMEQLFVSAQAEGLTLVGVSGYRSYATQKAIFTSKARSRGYEEANTISAYPGQSEHQTGLAMDVSCSAVNYGLQEAFSDTPEGKWLQQHAAEFGFIIRYPADKTDITGYTYEPWHLRYVGVDAASAIAAGGLTLEEYLGEN